MVLLPLIGKTAPITLLKEEKTNLTMQAKEIMRVQKFPLPDHQNHSYSKSMLKYQLPKDYQTDL